METTNQHEKSCPFTATAACKCTGPACALWDDDHGCAIRSTVNVVPALLEISDKLDRIIDAIDD